MTNMNKFDELTDKLEKNEITSSEYRMGLLEAIEDLDAYRKMMIRGVIK